MSDSITFTVLGVPVPQGSMRGIVVDGKARMLSDNEKTGPFRQEVGWCALRALEGREQPFCAKHVPVWVRIMFVFPKPVSAKKSRQRPVVKPDADKLIRSCFDAMKGIMWHDDAQIVSVLAQKYYGTPARAEITVMKEEPL